MGHGAIINGFYSHLSHLSSLESLFCPSQFLLITHVASVSFFAKTTNPINSKNKKPHHNSQVSFGVTYQAQSSILNPGHARILS